MATLVSSLTIDSSANSGSTSITVPTCEACLFFWDGWFGDEGVEMLTAAINAAGFTLLQNLPITSGNDACGVGILLSPDAGTQNFTWDWSGSSAVGDGPVFYLAFYDDINAGDPVADSDADQTGGGGDTTKTITLSTPNGDEHVIGFVNVYNDTPDGNPTGGQTVIAASHGFNSNYGLIAEVDATGSPTTDFSGNGNYVKVVAVALKAVGGGPEPSVGSGRKSLLGVGV